MHHHTSLALLLTALVWPSAGQSAEALPPTFTKKPTVAKAGEKCVVSFAVDRETDVAVCVEDANGQLGHPVLNAGI